ncbi:MAG: threonine--tRNA ligase [Patescibacteria group bacterium]
MEQVEKIRHSLAHLLAAAVMEFWPKTKLAIGPTIENGFYYDIDFSKVEASRRPTSGDFKRIESRMKELIKENQKFIGKKVSKAAAKKLFKNSPYKLEIIKELPGKTVGIYQNGNFLDLCKGGHVESTKEINPNAFKLTKIAGAYWRGDEKNKMLTRIYGVAFETEKELKDYLKTQEEAEKRDHKILGPQLELFMFHPTAPGMPYWLPKGVIVLNELISFWREEHKNDYREIISPILNKKELYIISGHYKHYWEEMFVVKTPGKEEYGVKAMNCPNAMIVFGSKLRSYRDLPLRFSDTDPLHRYERSGVLNALLRTRQFRQDDAHCFITEEQIESEYENIFKIVKKFYSIFDIKYEYRLGTRPDGFLGDKKTWDAAENTLRKILKESKITYKENPKDGAFYGPKVDIVVKDSIGRPWQMGTIQLDFQQPHQFKLEYTDINGQKKTPVVIHRVIYGSLERFIGFLIEHYVGAFPVWLSPVQVAIIPISDKHISYAKGVKDKLIEARIRPELIDKNETLGKKIRGAEIQKIPYLLIVGDKEIQAQLVSVRQRGKGDLGQMKLEEFVEKIREEISKKR